MRKFLLTILLILAVVFTLTAGAKMTYDNAKPEPNTGYILSSYNVSTRQTEPAALFNTGTQAEEAAKAGALADAPNSARRAG